MWRSMAVMRDRLVDPSLIIELAMHSDLTWAWCCWLDGTRVMIVWWEEGERWWERKHQDPSQMHQVCPAVVAVKGKLLMLIPCLHVLRVKVFFHFILFIIEVRRVWLTKWPTLCTVRLAMRINTGWPSSGCMMTGQYVLRTHTQTHTVCNENVHLL